VAQPRDDRLPSARPDMRDYHDIARPDLDRVVGDQPERHNLASADHAVAKVAQVPSLLLTGPAQDIRRVLHHQAHPFGPRHPASSTKSREDDPGY